jgi:molybdopterin molybdotransferase
MLEVADALAVVLQAVRPLTPSPFPIGSHVAGQVLADDVRADADSPPFPKSLRDGYAVRSADTPGELLVVEEIPAGVIPSKSVGAGEAARIFTGAPIPDGADAVVMQEDAEARDDRVTIKEAAKPGQFVFPRGHEMRAGDVVLSAGTVLNPAAVGVLASVGHVEPLLYPRPRVAVLATGDELVHPSERPSPGRIRNSNSAMLTALAIASGAAAVDMGIAPDTNDALRDRITAGLFSADVLVLAGGVSVGKFDLVPGVLEELGTTILARKVRMKPGKPFLFGTAGGPLVFGLPGNPVSAFVCFHLFVKPALRALAGYAAPEPRTATMPMAEAMAESNDRPTYRPAVVEGGAVRPLAWAGAPDLRGMQPADALLVLPPGDTRLDAGQPVEVILLD